MELLKRMLYFINKRSQSHKKFNIILEVQGKSCKIVYFCRTQCYSFIFIYLFLLTRAYNSIGGVAHGNSSLHKVGTGLSGSMLVNMVDHYDFIEEGFIHNSPTPPVEMPMSTGGKSDNCVGIDKLTLHTFIILWRWHV